MRRIVTKALHSAAVCAALIGVARPLAAEALPDTSLTKEVRLAKQEDQTRISNVDHADVRGFAPRALNPPTTASGFSRSFGTTSGSQCAPEPRQFHSDHSRSSVDMASPRAVSVYQTAPGRSGVPKPFNKEKEDSSALAGAFDALGANPRTSA
jgi:hypothetical protein